MSTLGTDIGPYTSPIYIPEGLSPGSYPAPYTIDSEAVLVTSGPAADGYYSVLRGQNGTAPASHSYGATVTAGWGGGGGSLTLTDGRTTIAMASSLHLPPNTLSDLGAGEAGASQPLLGPFHFNWNDPDVENPPTDNGAALGPVIPANSIVTLKLFITTDFDGTGPSLAFAVGAASADAGGLANVLSPNAGTQIGVGNVARVAAVFDADPTFVTNADCQVFVAFFHTLVASQGAADLYLQVLAQAS